MDLLSFLFGIFGFVMYVIAPILAWVAFLRSRKAVKDRQEIQRELRALQHKIETFEKTIVALKEAAGGEAAPGEKPAEPSPEAEVAIAAHEEALAVTARAEKAQPSEEEKPPAMEYPVAVVPEAETIPARTPPPAEKITGPVPVTPAAAAKVEAERIEPGPEPLVTKEVEEPVTTEEEVVEAPPPKETPPQAPTQWAGTALGRGFAQISAVLFPADRQEGDWETRIGRNWLNIIGIIVLVVGLVLLIQQTLLFLGASGKIALGAGVAVLLVGGGLYQERQERYRIFARTLVGGGWALLYFTAYAAYNIEAAKIIMSEKIALFALLGTAAAIIAHSFAYQSQFVTGLAYGLGFLALHLSPISFYSLVAVAILAGSIVAVIRFTDWRMLGLLIVVATYGTHARWLWETELARQLGATEIVLSGLPPQAAFWANMGLLFLYWALFCAAALVRPVTRKSDRLMDLGTSVLNMIGLLSLCYWQMVEHIPGNTHYLAAAATLAFAAIALVDRVQQRPLLSQFNGSAAVVLYACALPLALEPEGLSTDWLAPYWTAGAALVWLIGYRAGRALYRYEAYAMAALALAAALMSNFAGRMTDKDPALWFAALSTLVLFQGFIEILRDARENPRFTQQDYNFAVLAVPGSAALFGAASWSVVARYEAGIVWAIAGILLLEIGGRMDRPLLRAQSYLLGLASFAGFAWLNLWGDAPSGNLPGWSYALAGAALFYLASARLLFAGWPLSNDETTAGALPAAMATILYAGGTYQALPLEHACFAWVVWALILQEVGGRSDKLHLRLQGYVLGAMSFAAFLVLLFGDTEPAGDLPGWSYALAGAAFFYLASARLIFAGWPLVKSETTAASAPAALATILYAAGTYEALPLAVVCVAWIVWALALQQTGRVIGKVRISEQGLVLGGAAFAIAAAVNVYQTGDPVPIQLTPNWLALAVTTAGLYLLHVRLRGAARSQLVEAATKSDALLHAATLLFALLIWRELPSVTVALAWAALGLALFELSARTGNATLRQQSHLLMIAAFARLFMANFITPGEAFGISHRIISVVPVIVTLYYLRARMLEILPVAGSETSTFFRIRERDVGASLYAWAAAILLVVLARFEVGSAYAVAVWAPIFVVFLVLGLSWDNRDFRFQSYLLALLLFARSWTTNAYLEGSLFGIPERIVTALPVLVAFLFAVIRTPRKARKLSPWDRRRVVRFLQYFDTYARSAFAILFSLLTALLIVYQLSIDLVSIGWAVEALSLFALGFAIKERSLRLSGLVLLLVCLVKVTFLDLRGVETIYRVFSFIVLGVILLLISLGYSRYRRILEKYI